MPLPRKRREQVLKICDAGVLRKSVAERNFVRMNIIHASWTLGSVIFFGILSSHSS